MGVIFVFGLLLTSFHIGYGQPSFYPESRSFPSFQRWVNHRSWDAPLEPSFPAQIQYGQYPRELITSNDVDNFVVSYFCCTLFIFYILGYFQLLLFSNSFKDFLH